MRAGHGARGRRAPGGGSPARMVCCDTPPSQPPPPPIRRRPGGKRGPGVRWAEPGARGRGGGMGALTRHPPGAAPPPRRARRGGPGVGLAGAGAAIRAGRGPACPRQGVSAAARKHPGLHGRRRGTRARGGASADPIPRQRHPGPTRPRRRPAPRAPAGRKLARGDARVEEMSSAATSAMRALLAAMVLACAGRMLRAGGGGRGARVRRARGMRADPMSRRGRGRAGRGGRKRGRACQRGEF
jgi:hypothetical protein